MSRNHRRITLGSSGARLTVHGTGISGSSAVLTLPSARWMHEGTAARPRYRYRDMRHEDGPVTRVTIRDGKLALRARGAAPPSLAGAPQGTVGLRLKLGTGIEFCAAAPAKVPAASNDTPANFLGEPNTPPPAVCPAVP